LLLMASTLWGAERPDVLSQAWQRDASGPVVSLGASGSFDDTHIFAPCVIVEKGVFSLYYCGSTNDVANRVFQMGLATSADGIHFTKRDGPVFDFGDGKRSVLTPTILRDANGDVLREEGKLRLWFASTDFAGGTGIHTLHESSSADGIHWTPPSPAQMEGIYAPTIIKENGVYRMWYSDVTAEPWIVRHAQSLDGKNWERTDAPCVVIDQAWETNRLFYPAVLKHGDAYVMWYGAYWADRDNTTAIGTATSADGLTWTKSPGNPVLKPDEARPWESHYTTSQSVLKLDDGAWRMWYASRKAPPFKNKYFAINTAVLGPPEKEASPWPERAAALRNKMRAALTIPSARVPLAPKTHRTTAGDGYSIESVSYGSEADSRVTALLYIPDVPKPAPAIVIACGHGGSKSALYAQYGGQLYAKYGFVCLVVDTIGEEERNKTRKMGARGHDLYHLPKEARADFMNNEMKRSVLGKIVWDLMRGVDYLESKTEVDPKRIGVVGNSLGGASSGCLAILDSRIKSAVVSGWGFYSGPAEASKPCTMVPYRDFVSMMDFGEMTALLAPHAATLFINGTADTIIDPVHGGAALQEGVEWGIRRAETLLNGADVPNQIDAAFVKDACHRPYFLTSRAVRWVADHLQGGKVDYQFATINYGQWADAQGQKLETLYATEARQRGTSVVDIGAFYRDPATLACLPLDVPPDPEYTFWGWMESCVQRNGGAQ
jgi:dienelactone hydrolase